jgi:hypothetical protein
MDGESALHFKGRRAQQIAGFPDEGARTRPGAHINTQDGDID